MRRLRVMHVIHQLGTGGAENGIINLVNHIDQTRFKTSICAFVGDGTLSGRLDRARTDLYELGKKNGNDCSVPMRLWKLLRKWKPHILHTHAWGTLCEGLIAARLAGVPAIVHGEHGTIQQKPRNIPVQRFFWCFTDQVLAVSGNHRKQLAKTIGYQEEKVKVIFNGVDTSRFSASDNNEAIRNAMGIKPNDVVIGTVGRLVPVKNQAVLIKAFSILAKVYPNIKLLMVGDGPLQMELSRLATSLEVSSRVMFLGRRHDVPQILKALDIFALPSESEGMSNTILEAMATALPVVATDVGGNSEIVEKNVTGFLVEPNSPIPLADACRYLLENQYIRNEMGRAARRRVTRSFCLTAMIQNYECLYMDLLEKKVPPSKLNPK